MNISIGSSIGLGTPSHLRFPGIWQKTYGWRRSRKGGDECCLGGKPAVEAMEAVVVVIEMRSDQEGSRCFFIHHKRGVTHLPGRLALSGDHTHTMLGVFAWPSSTERPERLKGHFSSANSTSPLILPTETTPADTGAYITRKRARTFTFSLFRDDLYSTLWDCLRVAVCVCVCTLTTGKQGGLQRRCDRRRRSCVKS